MSAPSWVVNLGLVDSPSWTMNVPATDDIALNLMFILVDDIGVDVLEAYDDVNPYQTVEPSLQPGIYPNTPNIDALVSGGVRFRNARAQPVCSPSRASWLTGKHPFRTGVGTIIDPDRVGALAEFNDAPYTNTLATTRLKSLGFTAGITGKWHLGLPTVAMDAVDGNNAWQGWDHIPNVGDWDDWRCIWSNPNKRPTPTGVPSDGSYYEHIINRNGTQTSSLESVPNFGHDNEPAQYLTTLQMADAINFANTTAGQWFLYVPLNTAHSPFNLPPEAQTSTAEFFNDASQNIGNNFRAKVEALDYQIGQMLTGIDSDVLARTVIMFMGDNGTDHLALKSHRDDNSKVLGATYDFLLDPDSDGDTSDNRFKTSTYHRGVQVPLVVYGPANVVKNPGRVSDALVDITDVHPTLVELAGGTAPSGIDGISFKPILENTVDETTHARQFCLNEAFSPNGSWSTITAPETATNYVRRSYERRDMTGGWFRLIRYLGQSDELYLIRGEDGADIDPFEKTDLAADAKFAAQLTQLQSELDGLLAEESGGLKLPITDEDGNPATIVTNADDDIPITDENGAAATVVVTGTSIDITDENGNPASIVLSAV